MIDIHMAQIVIFPDQASFEAGIEALQSVKISFEAIEPPDFCLGLTATSILVAGMSTDILGILKSKGVFVSGIVPHVIFRRDVPEADPPDSKWREILGEFRVTSIKPSLTDPTRLRVESVCEKSLDALIPYMARFIRGGAFHPDGPVLAFEEEHRLLSFWGNKIVICRADDLLDAWILIRSAIELIIQAWERKETLMPEKKVRLGIGSVEIFKRLPSTNCKVCGHENCVEFSLALLTGRSHLEQCVQIHEKSEYLESLEWLLRAVGLMPRDTSVK